MLNEVFREHAEKGGIGYIDVGNAFLHEDGDFSMRGPDVNGQTRLLRTADGLNFTKAGARKLALFLEREIGRIVLHPAPAEPAVAAPETNSSPIKPSERPLAGPVVPLTDAPPLVKGDALLGAARPVPADVRLLGGEPAAPARGRADDFSWPRSLEVPLVPEGPGYAYDGSEVASRSGKPGPRGSIRKSRENAR